MIGRSRGAIRGGMGWVLGARRSRGAVAPERGLAVVVDGNHLLLGHGEPLLGLVDRIEEDAHSVIVDNAQSQLARTGTLPIW